MALKIDKVRLKFSQILNKPWKTAKDLIFYQIIKILPPILVALAVSLKDTFDFILKIRKFRIQFIRFGGTLMEC